MIKKVKKLIAFALILSVLASTALPGNYSLLSIKANAAEDEDQNFVGILKSGFPEDEEEESSSSTATTKNTTASASSKTNTKVSTKSAYSHTKIKESIQKAVSSYKNTDIKAWLIIPNTNISKPIAFKKIDPAKGINNSYYADRSLYGVRYPNIDYRNPIETASYLDSRVKLGETWKKSSKNIVVYGHNWTNLRESTMDVGTGSGKKWPNNGKNNHIMFAQLPSYTNMNFAKTNPYIYFSTEANEGVWKVFSVAYVELDSSFNYNNPNPKSADYQKLLKELKDRSIYNFDVDVNDKDRIITLSTCTRQYNVGDNQRFIVVARLLRDGESDKDTVKVTTNKNAKPPQFK